jgi:hypothetical protein
METRIKAGTGPIFKLSIRGCRLLPGLSPNSFSTSRKVFKKSRENIL